MKEKTVTLGGVQYDSHTGMRLTPRHSAARQLHPSATVHARVERSKTLNRKAASGQRPMRKSMDIQPRNKPSQAPAAKRHPMVKKFAPSQLADSKQTISTADTPDIAPTEHPHLTRANARVADRKSKPAQATAATLSSHEIKQRSISHALANATPDTQHRAAAHATHSRFSRGASIAGASLALLLLAGYFTYINMPNLSVRVAAAGAGIDASYPSYHPDGYALHGPVAYDAGQVSMKFASTGGPQNYTVTESRTDWDSTAAQQNYVSKKWGNQATTVIDHGLTIYTYDNHAAWVNNGIFYTITGDAPLSGEQLSHIATSM